MISVIADSNPSVCNMAQALNRSATSVIYDGHYYVIIKKGDSQFTKLNTLGDGVPVFNVCSRTIRTIKLDALVEIISMTINVTRD